MEMPQMCGYITKDNSQKASFSKKMAEVFNAKVTWAHNNSGKGRTLSFASEHDVPAIYTECPASRSVASEDVAAYLRGVKNVMTLINMTKGNYEGQKSKVRLKGDGDTDASIKAMNSGFFIARVKLLENVKENQLLGEILDLTGEIVESVYAPKEGVIGLRRLLPTVKSGDNLFLLAENN